MNARNSESVSSVARLCQVLQFAVVYLLMVTIVIGKGGSGVKENSAAAKYREKRTVTSSQIPPGNEELMNIMQEYDTNSVDINLLRYTPTTPSPEDVNCYVEVPVTRRVGGRCVLLGSSNWGCQAGIFLAFSSECYNVASSHPGYQAASDEAPQGGTNRPRNLFGRRRRPNRR